MPQKSKMIFPIDSDGDEEAKIFCPVCQDDYVHLEGKTLLLDGNDGYKARPGIVRGGVILIPAWCESGHRFALAFGFHKGQTLAWAERRPDLKDNETLPDMR